jgi:hypothetical protein
MLKSWFFAQVTLVCRIRPEHEKVFFIPLQRYLRCAKVRESLLSQDAAWMMQADLSLYDGRSVKMENEKPPIHDVSTVD